MVCVRWSHLDVSLGTVGQVPFGLEHLLAKLDCVGLAAVGQKVKVGCVVPSPIQRLLHWCVDWCRYSKYCDGKKLLQGGVFYCG